MAIQGDLDPAIREYLAKRVENIKSQLKVSDVLVHYGVDIRTVDREFQYPCPLHGDGQDNSYSARLYPDNDNGSGGTYCFACHKSRDAIQWVMDKEGLPSFGKTLSFIESAFHIDNVPKSVYSGEQSGPRLAQPLDKPKPKNTDRQQLEAAVTAVERSLTRLLKERREVVGMDKAARLYFMLDAVQFSLKEEGSDVAKLKEVTGKVWEVVRELSGAGS